MAVSDADGRVHIENLPVGNWTFQVWHEQAGYIGNVSLGGKPVSWKQGRMSLTIRRGENDLGDVAIAASQFQQ